MKRCRRSYESVAGESNGEQREMRAGHVEVGEHASLCLFPSSQLLCKGCSHEVSSIPSVGFLHVCSRSRRSVGGALATAAEINSLASKGRVICRHAPLENLQWPSTAGGFWSGFPRYFPIGAHDSRQVLMFQGKSCSLFTSFTSNVNVGLLIHACGMLLETISHGFANSVIIKV